MANGLFQKEIWYTKTIKIRRKINSKVVDGAGHAKKRKCSMNKRLMNGSKIGLSKGSDWKTIEDRRI